MSLFLIVYLQALDAKFGTYGKNADASRYLLSEKGYTVRGGKVTQILSHRRRLNETVKSS